MVQKHEFAGIAALFSGDFGRIASFFAKNAQKIEDESPDSPDRFLAHQAYVTGSIIASAAFLESLSNDVLTELSETESGRTWAERNQVFSRLWALGIPRTAAYSILQKYQVTLILTGREPFNAGRNPYQDAQTVVALRNELIHYEPKLQPLDGLSPAEKLYPVHKLVTKLKGKFPLNPMCAPSAPVWPFKLLGAGCAKWAILRAVAFVDAFAERFPIRHISRKISDIASDAKKLL